MAAYVQTPSVDQTPVADDYEEASIYRSEVASYTTSIVSSAVDYKYTNGRRYHGYKEGSYIYPNDENESDRLDLTHKMIEVAMDGKLFFAPIKTPRRVLDIGTGTGIWCIEFADRYPQADILGNDLSPPQARWVPEHVHFEVDDAEAAWTYSQKFDFVHARCMGTAIRDWEGLIKQSFEFLEPGGYAEIVDFDTEYKSPDGTLLKGTPVEQLSTLFMTETRKLGMEPNPSLYLEKWMTDAGFEDVKITKRFLPVGTWPADKHLKEVGAWNFLMVDEFLENFINYLYAKHLGLSQQELDTTCANVRKQLKDPRVHCMYTLWICYGRKPEITSKVDSKRMR